MTTCPEGAFDSLVRRYLPILGAMACINASLLAGRAIAQATFPPPARVESFEGPGGLDRWARDDGQPQTTLDNMALSATGDTHGLQSVRLAIPIDENHDNEFGWWSGTKYRGRFTPADGALYAAWTTALGDPANWQLSFDLTTTLGSWSEVTPPTPDENDLGILPIQSHVDVGVSYDGAAVGATIVNSHKYGTAKTTHATLSLKSIHPAIVPPPNPNYVDLYVQGYAADWRADTPPLASVYYYLDNFRLRSTVTNYDVVWDFENEFGVLQGWSDHGNSGVDTSHKHHIVTGLGATHVTPRGVVTPDAAGHALFVETSNIPPGTNGFQWGSTFSLNADANNDGVVDDAAAKAKMGNLVGRMKRADAIQFDVTFHDSTDPPPGLPPAVQPGEPNAPWLKIVMAITADSTPADGTAGGGLQQFQFDNEFAVDLAGDAYQISRGDVAGALTGGFVTPGQPIPTEPLTMTYGFDQFGGNLRAALAGSLFDNSNFFRISLAFQTGTGDATILAVLDNIRFVEDLELDADFDHDGDVDGDDLAIWQANGGAGDANFDEVIDGADALLWQQQAGNDATPAVAVGAAVPEPAAGALPVTAAVFRLFRIRNRNRRFARGIKL